MVIVDPTVSRRTERHPTTGSGSVPSLLMSDSMSEKSRS